MTTEKRYEEQLQAAIDGIRPFNKAYARRARQHSDGLTKPPGSLGRLEDLAAQLAGITGELWPELSRKAVIVMAADHGVCEEGVSAFPSSVTPLMVHNFLAGGAAVNVLARQAGAEVVCVDVGVAAELEHPMLLSRKVMMGTHNMAKGAAMNREQALQAILTGIEVVSSQAEQGVRLFATGEMGIGNTTASAAIASVLAELSPEQAVGRGTGISDEALAHKVKVVQRAIAVNDPDRNDPVDVVAKVGGLEIAGLAGVYIGAAMRGCPVVVDGFISSAAALVALKLAEGVRPYLIASHLSHEQGHRLLLEKLGLQPMVQLGMRLGEGTGAVLAFHYVEAALRLMQEMATFEDIGLENS
ncbi:nicotinate-nucleotide--dimethylbenzimidazole phosphoribosyltransferase [Paenibacillus sp. J5C_2022]|uniref:nicotinate-nucleotide--dimethylbenzimidazole phosphoribosyltransferase n=1 Tax=Paenibacillus sp. J5C2022 TaxID=2977129 RepID=UPI0021CE977F|nr:nicotinate-nucleotide--dimethylbenzimidazole phosphoribosyltransferase [Paenibacillus sp. J5C2022]MCU6707217.1 nicotinate-nucleotide--dimethylbenzimidazole phosphoribosyltransferase [Paenibacillus sp. J5C2022]